MKKNYTVSEEEKNRILGLHESFKNNKLGLVNEQDPDGGDGYISDFEEGVQGLDEQPEVDVDAEVVVTGTTTTDLGGEGETESEETVDDILKDIKIVTDSEEKTSENGEGDGSGKLKVKGKLSKVQDATEVRNLVTQIQKIQQPLVAGKSKVNLFKNIIAAKRMSRRGYVGQVMINGYGSIIMNDRGSKMIGITFPVLMKNPKGGKYNLENKLTYKFLLNKLTLGEEKVVANKKFRGYLKKVEIIHKDLNKELSKIPQGDF